MLISSPSHGIHIISVLITALPLVPALAVSQEVGSGKLDIKVEGFRESEGGLGCQIFASAKGFPMDPKLAKASAYVPLIRASAVCSFENLPAGAYAVAVVHDENGNQELDTNLFGIPKEGYGVSNNKTYAASQPKWEESKFELGTGERKLITIKLRY